MLANKAFQRSNGDPMFQQCGLTAVNLDSYPSYHQQPAKCWPTEAERNSVCVCSSVDSVLFGAGPHSQGLGGGAVTKKQ